MNMLEEVFNMVSYHQMMKEKTKFSGHPEYLENKIADRLDDPEKAHVIRAVYEKYYIKLNEAWNSFDTDTFRNWLISHSELLGSISIDHQTLFMETFDKDFLTIFRCSDRCQKYKQVLGDFFDGLQKEWGEKQKLHTTSAKNVVVLTRNCGNGHHSASKGIKQYLLTQNYQIHIVNGSHYEESDFIRILTQGNKINSGLQDLRGRVKELNPDLIINTVAHHSSWRQIGYDLNIPFLVVHTDYEVNHSVVFNNRFLNDNSSIVQYCLPNQTKDDNRVLIEKALSAARYSSLVKEIGFPIRAAFQRETNTAAIEKLRNELKIRSGESVVIIMGHAEPDTTRMFKIIRQLKAAPRNFAHPLCVIAVTGNEKDVASRLKSGLKLMNHNPFVRVIIENYLDEEKLAKYMKVASRVQPIPGLLMSKRGGSTTAESTEMGVYTIWFPTKSKEKCNGDYLERHGLGEEIDPYEFVNQITRAVKWKGNPDTVFKSPLNWRKNLTNLVAEKLN